MKIWGCKVYVKRQTSTKLEPKSERCIFVGYLKETKGYYFFNPTENKVFVARTGVFLEREFISRKRSGRKIKLEEIRESQDTTEPEIEQQQILQEIEEQDLSRSVASPDSEKWLETMRSEMDSMYENQVWTLVDPPEGVKPVGCKWVFKKKTDMDGNVQTYKGRLVAKGFRQIHGVDYDETFSPVAMFKPIKILLAIAAFYNYEIWQMDVKTAFLNGKLEEDVYMTQPEGFVNPKDAGKICKLQRSIYGLKQASRSWNLRFNDAIKYTIIFLVLYVDDILIMGNDIPTLQSIKTWLGSCFSMKDLGEATYILGRITTYETWYFTLEGNVSFNSTERERMSKIPYDSAIGSIMYAMVCTRPDVSYALCMTSRYQVDPGEGHWTTVKNILKYLRRTKDTFLIYRGEEKLSVKGYADASFQPTRMIFDRNQSSKQSTVVDSTTEAEYIAASEAAKEVVWIKKFITELRVVPSKSDAIEHRCDNNGAIAQAKEPRSHQRSKHILRRYHLIREIIDRGDVEICRVLTDNNIADPLTKPLTQQKHDRHTKSLGIRYMSDWS
ncbi:hypothetical protein CXB51_001188 [Gossypium anomalum]|uniref:Reverse transcriptase Ty1/copia-type domain-containing protein n=1 Tax=Gossypium anomalum TaxID=47600 RepID=A0A8J6D9C8_9ROSI|nr:hypothetical protein CXB51_001188 [Gossypium anomalum]